MVEKAAGRCWFFMFFPIIFSDVSLIFIFLQLQQINFLTLMQIAGSSLPSLPDTQARAQQPPSARLAGGPGSGPPGGSGGDGARGNLKEKLPVQLPTTGQPGAGGAPAHPGAVLAGSSGGDHSQVVPSAAPGQAPPKLGGFLFLEEIAFLAIITSQPLQSVLNSIYQMSLLHIFNLT